MLNTLSRFLAIFLAVQFLFPCNLLSATTSSKAIVVVSVHDGISDNISDDLVDSFSKALAGQKLQVVTKDKVETVLNYYQPDKKEVSGNLEAEEAMSRAKDHYYNFDYPEALAQILKAIKLMESEPSRISDHGTSLRDAYVVAGIIEKSNKGGSGAAGEYFEKALKIDPQYSIDEKAFPPSIVDLFKGVRAKFSQGNKTGSILVETDPKVAEVYVNGVLKGVTPIVMSSLPEGDYSVAIKTNKYKTVEKKVALKTDDTVKIKEKLAWTASPGEKPSKVKNILTSKDDARYLISEGVRIAEILKVPKVVLIDADQVENGSGEIAIRMVDRTYKAGHNPVVIGYTSSKKSLAADLSKASSILVSQYNANILNDPQKNLDPDGIGDPVLLGKRKRALLALPAFWAIVGGILAATAGGATAAVVMGGGDSGSGSGTGSVNVQFK